VLRPLWDDPAKTFRDTNDYRRPTGRLHVVRQKMRYQECSIKMKKSSLVKGRLEATQPGVFREARCSREHHIQTGSVGSMCKENQGEGKEEQKRRDRRSKRVWGGDILYTTQAGISALRECCAHGVEADGKMEEQMKGRNFTMSSPVGSRTGF